MMTKTRKQREEALETKNTARKESTMADTYKTTLCGAEYTIRGNFAEASSPVEFDGQPTQYQVADFAHSPTAAMRRHLEKVLQADGDDPAIVQELIDEAIEAIK